MGRFLVCISGPRAQMRACSCGKQASVLGSLCTCDLLPAAEDAVLTGTLA